MVIEFLKWKATCPALRPGAISNTVCKVYSNEDI
jgi:hypothetical protein